MSWGGAPYVDDDFALVRQGDHSWKLRRADEKGVIQYAAGTHRPTA